MELALASGGSVPVPARLLYTSRDPFAVHIDFHTGLGDPVRWAFSRHLLAEGLRTPSSNGDVRLWPSGAGRGALLKPRSCLAVRVRPARGRAPGGGAVAGAYLSPGALRQ
ncbi:SsgA family sporulation/cell division regulator [Streptomyces sp. NBC_01549]|uniref:SsgA family sporulation/cell division regulator n=1 Tax=Streptomyces sp. NBC_01549 TaxID=2975874 RepID=UPI00224F71A9|nr:SsgA family sporulation/cell division regulator [Streptomyces sp. NBC_01549]MCX4596761.1 SsgA family sporulation/cell division regulator [Streptomyces sp. NBC_01549]